MSWLTAGLWVGSLALVAALLIFVSSPHKKLRRGGFSVQHLLMLQSVWEPGKMYVLEEKQKQVEQGADEGGPKDLDP